MLLFDFIRYSSGISSTTNLNDIVTTKNLLDDKEYDFCNTRKNKWWSNYMHVSHGNLIENWKREIIWNSLTLLLWLMTCD